MNVAESFWSNKSIDEYKQLATTWGSTQRLSYDIQKIIPHVRHSKRIIDLACGDGKIVNILNNIFNFEKIYINDINPTIAFNTALNSPLNVEQCVSCNLNERLPKEIEDSDTVLILGVLIYILDNQRITEILNQLKDKTVIIRTSCAEEERYINSYSEEFKEQYEAKYRTINWFLNQIKSTHTVVKHERLYPKEIDSKYSTIQYLIVGKN
jgi:2-polyprenyl-3-methyl-5-hydroxy-6-metoxy-1,4-benzoquinol methylase